MSTNSIKARSYFCVLNNVNHIFDKDDKFFEAPQYSDETREKVANIRETFDKKRLTPEEVVDHLINLWVGGITERRSCAVNYEIGDNGTHHCHMVLEDKSQARLSAVKKLFPAIHTEITKGTKKDVVAYIEKQGKFQEKNHTLIVPAKYSGTIEAQQGKRTDLDQIAMYLEEGLTPEEIMRKNIHFRKFSKIIKEHFYQLRIQKAGLQKELKVVWHYGKAGQGKSYVQVLLKQKKGRENVYVMSDYLNGGLDTYLGEPYLVMDEFKGDISYGLFLNITDIYPSQIHARYANVYALWTEVHITSIFTPKEAYREMVDKENRQSDNINQMYRRIHEVIYHYKVDRKHLPPLFKTISFPMEAFTKYTETQLLGMMLYLHEKFPERLHYSWLFDIEQKPLMLPYTKEPEEK